MVEKIDYRVIEAKCTFIFDYIEEKHFDNFYIELKKLCDNHNVHISKSIRKEDVLPYKEDKKWD